MSWLCKQCETENTDDLQFCEVCGSTSPNVTPLIKSFEAINKAYINDSVDLTWEVELATGIYLNGTKVEKGVNHSMQTLKGKATIFILEAYNGEKITKKTLTIEALSEPNISFKLSSNKIAKGENEHAILKWNIQNAHDAYLLENGKEKQVPLKGERIVTSESTTTYTLKVIGIDSVKTFSKKQTLYVLPKCSIDFNADKLFTLPKVPIQLSWSVKNAKAVELVGYGAKGLEGKHLVEIEKDSVFELKVMDAFGLQKRTIKIKILPLPIINGIMAPTPEISEKVVVQTKLSNMTATIPALGNLASPIDVSRLSIPSFDGIKVEMKGMPTIVSTPNFHLLQLDVGRTTWWGTLKNKFRELNTYLQNIK